MVQLTTASGKMLFLRTFTRWLPWRCAQTCNCAVSGQAWMASGCCPGAPCRWLPWKRAVWFLTGDFSRTSSFGSGLWQWQKSVAKLFSVEADEINLGTIGSELCLFSSTQDLSLLPFYSRKLGTLPVCVPGHRTLSLSFCTESCILKVPDWASLHSDAVPGEEKWDCWGA